MRLIQTTLLATVTLLSFSIFAQSPGNVSTNLSAWYKADAGVTGTTNVSLWADQSGNGNNAIQNTTANQPALVTGDINFKSSLLIK